MDSFDGPVILDACVLLNLHFSDLLHEVVKTCEGGLLVETYVLRHEAHSLGISSGDSASAPIQAPAGLQHVRIETDEEAKSVLELAGTYDLDDGESRSIAIGLHRECVIATDERKARSVMASRYPHLRYVGTPELMHSWATNSSATPEKVQIAITKIEQFGRYSPGRREPLYTWWMSMRDI